MPEVRAEGQEDQEEAKLLQLTQRAATEDWRDGIPIIKTEQWVPPRDTTLKLFPEITRQRGFDPYKTFNVSSKRGAKFKTKEDYANKLANHLFQNSLTSSSISGEKTMLAYKEGILVGKPLIQFRKIIIQNSGFYNEALALAYKRFNYTKYKYNKKKWVENPIPLQLYQDEFSVESGSGQAKKINLVNDALERIRNLNFARTDGIPQTTSMIKSFTGAPRSDNVKYMPGLLHLAAQYLVYKINAYNVGNVEDHTFKTQESLIAVDIKETDRVYVGAFRLQDEYAKNKHVQSKFLFAKARGYNVQFMQYGVSLKNHCLKTMFVAIFPRLETGNVDKPIYAVPLGQSLTIPKTMIDFDDVIFIFGVSEGLNMANSVNQSTFNDPQVSTLLAVTSYLKISTFMRLKNNEPLAKWDENKRTYKPKLSEYQLKTNNMQVGKINAKDADVDINIFGNARMFKAEASFDVAKITGRVSTNTEIEQRVESLFQRLPGGKTDASMQAIGRLALQLAEDVRTETQFSTKAAIKRLVGNDSGIFRQQFYPSLSRLGFSPEELMLIQSVGYGDTRAFEFNRAEASGSNPFLRPR